MNLVGGKLRSIRLAMAVVVASILMLFQNCAPMAPQCAEGSSDPACGLASQTPSENNPTPTSSSEQTPGISVPNPGSSTSTSGGVTLPGGSTSGTSGNGVSLPGGSTGSSGGSSSGSINYQDQTFRIIQQPEALAIPEGSSGSLSVGVYGGASPYSYQWYKDSAAISFGTGSIYGITADRFSREGLYYVIVRDANGLSVQSQQVRVSVTEVPGDCAAGAYAAFLRDTTALTGESIRDLFIWGNNKYLPSVQHPAINYLYNNQRYLGANYIQIFNIPNTVRYKGVMNIACNNPISQIHSPTTNPGAGYEEGGIFWNNYNDGYGYRWSGQVTFECVNKKYRLLSNTCQWERLPVQDSY